jgi:hypothetical protein
MQFADFLTNETNHGKLTVNEDIGINLSAQFLDKVWNWLFTDEQTFFTFGNNTKIPPRWVKKGRQCTVQTCKVGWHLQSWQDQAAHLRGLQGCLQVHPDHGAVLLACPA